MKVAPKLVAKEIMDTANRLGWTVHVRGSILTITKRITPGSNDSFAQADGEYYDILGRLPTTSPGSIWGTDGGGIGGMTAMNTGVFTMHKSGGSKAVLKQLVKLKGGLV